MRMPLIAVTVATATLALAAPASAQVASGSGPRVMHRQGGTTIHRAPLVQHRSVVMRNDTRRWGRMNGGRWYAGGDAPGGWQAYRRPVRGWTVPRYWMAPSFYVYDWSNYGLSAPATGYNWARYYDDAVLIDGRGRVRDVVSGIDWYDDVDEETYASAGPNDGRFDDDYATGPDGEPPMAGAPYPPLGPAGPPPAPGRRRDNGVGGAVIGGVVGAVAGNLIAGRGNRLGGSLIGAGVGAIAGAAIDQAEDRGRGRDYDRRYDDRWGPGPGAGYAPPRVDRRIYRDHNDQGGNYGPAPVYHGNGVTVVTSGGGHYGYGATTTVVTVQPAVTTTTTTKEYVYETVRAAPRKRWKAKPRCVCPPSKLIRR